MDTTRATAEAVEAARLTAAMTRKDLALASGIPYTTLYRKLDGLTPFNVREIEQVAAPLGVRPDTLAKFPAVA